MLSGCGDEWSKIEEECLRHKERLNEYRAICFSISFVVFIGISNFFPDDVSALISTIFYVWASEKYVKLI